MNYRYTKAANLSEYINHTFVRLLIVFTMIISILIITPLAAASELDDFEEAATTDNSKQESDDQKEENQDEEDDDQDGNFFSSLFGDFFEFIFNETTYLFFSAIANGTKMSLARVDESTETSSTEVEIRQTGEPTLPFFEMEHKYMYVNSDINALDDSLEFGYGPYGFKCRNTRFDEINPSDKLTLTQYHLLLRISETASREYGIGVGRLIMRGNENNSGFSLTFPIKIYPNQSFGIRIKPTYSWINGNSISDTDLSIAFTKRYGSLELGYRFLEANGVDLDGSYIGFALHY